MSETTRQIAAFPPLFRGKRKKVGPYSRRLAFGSLDLRTREGQFAADVRDALTAQLGGDPTPAQQMIIQMAALKALRCELLCRKTLFAETVSDHDHHHLLSWMNGLRRDLEALGLDPVHRPVDPLADLHAYIAHRDDREGDAA